MEHLRISGRRENGRHAHGRSIDSADVTQKGDVADMALQMVHRCGVEWQPNKDIMNSFRAVDDAMITETYQDETCASATVIGNSCVHFQGDHLEQEA